MDVTELRRAVSGPVFLPDEPGHPDERTGYNHAIPQQPALIVGAINARRDAGRVRSPPVAYPPARSPSKPPDPSAEAAALQQQCTQQVLNMRKVIQ
jgi:hypothetical protein